MVASFYVQNFGCRATQADGAAIERQFEQLGLDRALTPTSAEIVILNTCTVTASADQDARAAIRRLHREHPDARIVVTGCYAQRAPEELAALPGVSQVIGNSHKHQLAEIALTQAPNLTPPPVPDKIRSGGFVPVSHLSTQPISDSQLRLGQRPTTDDQRPIFVSDIFAHTELLAAPVFDAANERTRPNLKIQDGCDNRCSFCVIPYVRGQSRSMRPQQILQEVRALVSAGYQELVISGINLGRWGRDLEPEVSSQVSGARSQVPGVGSQVSGVGSQVSGVSSRVSGFGIEGLLAVEASDSNQNEFVEAALCRDSIQRLTPDDRRLVSSHQPTTISHQPSSHQPTTISHEPFPDDFPSLIRAILASTSLAKLRISSVEPMDWTDDLISLVAASPRIAKHAHVPMQSGSDAVLRRMHRKYRPWHYREKIEKIRAAMPTAAIGADVMVGFPGETEAEFNETRRLIEDLPFTYLHVFTYSPRPGTPAADMPHQAPVHVARERNRILRDLAAEKKLAFMRSFVGKTLDAITLSCGADTSVRDSQTLPATEALTDNYLPLRLRGQWDPNQWLSVQIEAIEDGKLVGAISQH